jgi:hypothetical protein
MYSFTERAWAELGMEVSLEGVTLFVPCSLDDEDAWAEPGDVLLGVSGSLQSAKCF